MNWLIAIRFTNYFELYPDTLQLQQLQQQLLQQQQHQQQLLQQQQQHHL